MRLYFAHSSWPRHGWGEEESPPGPPARPPAYPSHCHIRCASVVRRSGVAAEERAQGVIDCRRPLSLSLFCAAQPKRGCFALRQRDRALCVYAGCRTRAYGALPSNKRVPTSSLQWHGYLKLGGRGRGDPKREEGPARQASRQGNISPLLPSLPREGRQGGVMTALERKNSQTANPRGGSKRPLRSSRPTEPLCRYVHSSGRGGLFQP